MKKLIISILLISITMFGCTGQTEPETEPPSQSPNASSQVPDPQPPSQTPDVSQPPVNVGAADFLNIIYPVYKSMQYHNLDEWQEYINEKFGIDINVEYKYFIPEVIDMANAVLYLNFTQGVSYEYNTRVLEMSDDKKCHEIGAYYDALGWDEFINPEYKDKLTVNGKIFAVPAVDEIHIVPRYYNLEYLSGLDMDIPRNIDEFYMYLSASKKLNADDGSFYPMCIWKPYSLLSSSDIFRAYGVYFNTYANMTITYNPNTGSFEDGMFAKGVDDALSYVRNLQKEGLLLFTGSGSYTKSDGSMEYLQSVEYADVNKNFATEYAVVYVPRKNGFLRDGLEEHQGPAYEHSEGYYLIGPNTENICEVRSEMAFYLFPKENDNLGGTMGLFNDIFTNDRYHADFRYGIKGEEYIMQDDRILPINPAAGAFNDLKSIRKPGGANAIYNQKTLEVIMALDEGFWFEKNVFNQFHMHTDYFDAHSQNDMVDVLFDENLTPGESIEEYRKMFKKAGFESEINKMNISLGVVTAYDYGQ